jgi:hypothetical protein
MKNIILSALVMAFVVVSCNQKNKQTETTNTPMMENDSTMVMNDSTMMMDKSTEKTDLATPTEPSPYVNDVIISYINLKNKLVNDDTNGAADKAKLLLASFNRFNTNVLDPKQKKEYLDIAESAKENAEHIGDNAGKLDHQREHFVLLSKDTNDLINLFGTKQKLYQDFCPMADDGKGAIWISETKEIKNPYLGAKMPTCGSVKKEF